MIDMLDAALVRSWADDPPDGTGGYVLVHQRTLHQLADRLETLDAMLVHAQDEAADNDRMLRAEIQRLREMLEDVAKAVRMLDRGGFIGALDEESEAECDNLRRIAMQTVDAYAQYRWPETGPNSMSKTERSATLVPAVGAQV